MIEQKNFNWRQLFFCLAVSAIITTAIWHLFHLDYKTIVDIKDEKMLMKCTDGSSIWFPLPKCEKAGITIKEEENVEVLKLKKTNKELKAELIELNRDYNDLRRCTNIVHDFDANCQGWEMNVDMLCNPEHGKIEPELCAEKTKDYYRRMVKHLP